MGDQNAITKRFVVISVIILIILIPVAAWVSASYLHKDRGGTLNNNITDQKITDTINEYIKNSEYIKKVSFVSSVKYEANWYLVTVKDSETRYEVVLCDFDQPKVIIGPGEYLTQFNISHMGVPYEILDALNIPNNTKDGDGLHEHDEYDD
jgi:hypothetical protein